jgi:signal transduction histidine kinase
MMSRVSEDAQPPRLSVRLARTLAGVSGWVRREAAEGWTAVRTAERRTVVGEALACVLAAAFCLLPLLTVPVERPLSAVLEGVWTALVVPARRGRPAAAVVCASLLLVGTNIWTLAVVPLIVLSATRRIAPPRRAWQVAGVACATVGVLTVAFAPVHSESLLLQLSGNAVSTLLLVLLPTLAGTLLGQRRPLVSLLRERNAYLEQTRTLAAAAARTQERTRIAGEMHDLLGHRLSLISVHAGALELTAARQAPALVEQAELLRTTAGTAMGELREILGVLRHSDLTDETDSTGEEKGTREDITSLVTESRRTGSTVELDWSVPETPELDLRTRQAIHRVVREGLTNVLKHAAGAPTRVEVKGTGKGIEVSVSNEAPRAANHSWGGSRSGLAGCQERIALLGGRFAAGTLANGGFRIAAWLPTHDRAPEPTAREGAFVETPPETVRLSSAGIGQEGARAPLSDEILTWPRVLGSGCVALLVVLPTVGFLVVLLTTAAVR